MNGNEEYKRPEEIERDLEQTRAEVSSTLDAIQEKLTPGQLMDQAIDYWRRSAPADFGSNLSRNVRDNPLPVALVGIGLGWLMMSTRKQETRYAPYREDYVSDEEDYDYGSAYDYDSASHGYGAMESNYGESGESALERAKSSASSAAEQVKDKAAELKARAGEGMQHMRDKASALSGRGSGRYEGMRHRAAGMRSSLSERAGSARARMSDLRERSREGYYRARGTISQTIDEQPLVLGAIGVAIGAALGATLPATRREDEWLGEQRDELLHRTRETARRYAEPMQESARNIAQEAEQGIRQTTGMDSVQEPASADEYIGSASDAGTSSDNRPTGSL